MPKSKNTRKNRLKSKKMPMASSANKALPLIQKSRKLLNLGELAEAGLILSEALKIDPNNFDAWNLLGVASLNLGAPERAKLYLEKAIELNSNSPDAHFNQALVMLQLNNTEHAEQCLRAAIAIQPNYTEALSTLGYIKIQLEQWEAARKELENAVTSNPDYPEAWINLCATLVELELHDDAIEAGLRGVELLPGSYHAYYNLASAYTANRDWKNALEYFDKAIEINPNVADIYVNKSECLTAIGSFVESEKMARIAIKIAPDNSKAYGNLAHALYHQNDHDNSIQHYRHAIELDANNHVAHNNLAHNLMLLEEFSTGWEGFEHGFACNQRILVSGSNAPIWTGQSLDGKCIHVYAEQGVGDQILFATMLPDLISAGAKVIYECDKRLVSLFERSFPDIMVIAIADPVDPILSSKNVDYCINSGSLGIYLRRSVSDFNPRDHFIKADPELTNKYKKKYEGMAGDCKIGISWHSGNITEGARRSISLEKWQPILSTKNCQFINLQYGDVDKDVANLKAKTGIDLFCDPTVDPLFDLETFTAQVASLDLVISIDNSTVHVAGALGVPTMVMLKCVPDWRWTKTRKRSLWYKSLRNFRPDNHENIESTIDKVLEALQDYLETR